MIDVCCCKFKHRFIFFLRLVYWFHQFFGVILGSPRCSGGFCLVRKVQPCCFDWAPAPCGTRACFLWCSLCMLAEDQCCRWHLSVLGLTQALFGDEIVLQTVPLLNVEFFRGYCGHLGNPDLVEELCCRRRRLQLNFPAPEGHCRDCNELLSSLAWIEWRYCKK